MKKQFLIMFLLIFIGTSPLSAIELEKYAELQTVMDSAKVLETEIYAPITWKKALKKFEQARKAVNEHKKQKTIDKYVNETREYVEIAIKACGVTKLSLQEYLEPRQKCIDAKAPSLVPLLYNKAELQFVKATKKVEAGNVKSGLKEAKKSTALFDTAELEAIRIDILGTADKLIEKAVADDAAKFALSTLDKARTSRDKANAIITGDRYNSDDAVNEAARAEYEARHASNIGLSVRSLKRNDQAWEKLMLVYEIQMNRVGNSIGLETLPFDNGPLAAADELIAYITELHTENDKLKNQMVDLAGNVNDQLVHILSRFGKSTENKDPFALVKAVDQQVSIMIDENNELSSRVKSSEAANAELAEQHDEISVELTKRTNKEEKFRKAKKTLNPSEGEVLFNSSNDIVLRLSGLSFDVGKSDIKDEHIPLLEKVKSVIEMFPQSQLMVEGHTDAQGDPSNNLLLSEKRAFAVMQYLRQSLLISVDRVSSMGYGADKPVASNQTSEGRTKNRRIDVIIMQ